METVIRNVEEIDVHDRQALEHVLGQELSEHRQPGIRTGIFLAREIHRRKPESSS
jgi:hypothetical protein